MVTMQTADNALKSYYLDAVSEALDMKTNPLFAQIKNLPQTCSERTCVNWCATASTGESAPERRREVCRRRAETTMYSS